MCLEHNGKGVFLPFVWQFPKFWLHDMKPLHVRVSHRRIGVTSSMMTASESIVYVRHILKDGVSFEQAKAER